MAAMGNRDKHNRIYLTAMLQVTPLILGSLLHLIYVQTHKPFIYDEMNWLEIFNESMVYSFAVSYLCLIKMPEDILEEGEENGGILQPHQTDLLH